MSELLSSIAGVPVYASDWWESGGPGAYSFSRGSQVYYVGMAGDVERRFREHRRAGLALAATHATVYATMTTYAAQRLERNLVMLLEPTHNDSRPTVTENERAWFSTLRQSTTIKYADRPNQTWGWCSGCGELVVFFLGMDLLATFGRHHECGTCESRPHWDPLGQCWETMGSIVAGLVGSCA